MYDAMAEINSNSRQLWHKKPVYVLKTDTILFKICATGNITLNEL